MRRIWHVIKREYIENVRTKAFLIGLVLTPVWMGIILLVPMLIDRPDRQRVVILDETGVLAAPLRVQLGKHEGTEYDVSVRPRAGADLAQVIEGLKRQAGEGECIALVLTPPILEKRAPKEGERGAGLYCSGSAGARRAARAIQEVVNDLVTEHVLQERQIPRETAKLIKKPAIQVEAVGKEGEEAGVGTMLLPMLAMMLLYMGIMGISQMLISSTLEEKGNRVFEVLLSSLSPFQLMTGKILGICAVGLTLLAVWSGGGLFAASMRGAGDIVSGAQLGWFFVYYLLGFLMIASLMVAIGSACNTIKEAQNLMAPISMLLALPLIVTMVTLENPHGNFATVASFIPPFTPFLMMARIASVPGPPDWQVWTTLLVMVLATYVAVRLAARVFRVGILLYGQPPSLGTIWKWMFTRD